MSRERVPSSLVVPEFLPAGTTAEYLGVSPNTLRRLKPYIHHLELPHDSDKRSVYQYPVPYIVPLRAALTNHTHFNLEDAAEVFSLSSGARNAILDAETKLDQDIASAVYEGTLSASDIGRVLNIGRSTVNGWKDKEYAEFEETDTISLEIGVESLKQVLTWNRPEAYDPLIRNLNDPLVPADLQLRHLDLDKPV